MAMIYDKAALLAQAQISEQEPPKHKSPSLIKTIQRKRKRPGKKINYLQ
jgi:hypothetical protein